jgi:hypothetical protein
MKYYSGDKIKESEMSRTCGTHGKCDRCIQGIGGRSEGNTYVGWEDIIKMDLQHA